MYVSVCICALKHQQMESDKDKYQLQPKLYILASWFYEKQCHKHEHVIAYYVIILTEL